MKLKNVKLIAALTLMGMSYAAFGAIFEFHNKTNQNIYIALRMTRWIEQYTIPPWETKRILSVGGCIKAIAISETGHHDLGAYNWFEIGEVCHDAAFDIMGTYGNIWLSSGQLTNIKDIK